MSTLRARLISAAGLEPDGFAFRPRRRRSARPDEIAHRLVLVVGVIVAASLIVSAVTVPGAAILDRTVAGLVKRFGGDPGSVVLPPIAQRSVVLARGGEVLATLAGEENRTYVSLSRVPPITQQAVISIEDAHFYEHRGVALGGLVRALLSNVRAGGVRQGGSTITQQLIKNTLVGKERTLDRKIREAKLAVALERRMSKRKILELYLNEAYFGQGVYGIGTAAEFYFGRDVSALGLSESALLAGLIKAPERYDPLRHGKAAKQRRKLVLGRMADEGYITRAQAERVSRWRLGASRHPLPKPVEPYFIEYVKAQIMADPRFGETAPERARAIFQGGLRIETTLDLDLQEAATKAVDTVLDRPGDPAAALVSIDPESGGVRAMVGGQDFEKLRYNLAVQGRRQAGSAFKPFTLVAALAAGISPGLTLDTPSPLIVNTPEGKVWKPQNYSHHGEGIMDMRRATELSVNSFYVQLIQRVGPERVVDIAAKMGIQTPLRPYLSLALGAQAVSPFEVTSAYATLAANGVYCKPFAIVRVTNALGEEILRSEEDCKRTIDAHVAAQATSILHGVIQRGTGRRNGQLGRPAAGKTGTTDFYSDAWFVGYTPQFSTAVWLGFPDSTKKKLYNIHGLPKVFGGSLPAMIWNRYMRAAHRGLAVRQFPAPPGVSSAVVPDVRGKPIEEATTALEKAGFSVRPQAVVSWQPAGTVIAQSPPPGETVSAGAMITVSVSDGTGPSPRPSPPPPSPRPSHTPSASPSPSAKPSASPSPAGSGSPVPSPSGSATPDEDGD